MKTLVLFAIIAISTNAMADYESGFEDYNAQRELQQLEQEAVAEQQQLMAQQNMLRLMQQQQMQQQQMRSQQRYGTQLDSSIILRGGWNR
jgi:ATPase subunit of ABC transporter with duplicated ATPase domains